MARDDWRLRIELGEKGAGGLLGHLGLSDAHQLAKDISKRIEAEMQYPGHIKVIVIRETRAVEVAK